MAAYRYFRVRITKNNSGAASNSLTQLAEWNFMASGSRVAPSSVVGLNDASGSEGPDKLDNNVTTDKWLGTLSGMQAVWDFGSAVTIDAYRWYTANDNTSRDPVSWIVEASDDPQAWWWTVVDTVTDYTVTASRNTLVNTWTITPPAPDTPPARNGTSGRYWRFSPTARRGGGDGLVQCSELHMMSEGRRVPSTSQSGPAGTGAEGVDQVDDWSLNSKLLSSSLANTQVVLDLGSAQFCDGYEWYTANDSSDRDPVSWTLEWSNDGSSYTTVDTQTGATITTDRMTLAYLGTVPDQPAVRRPAAAPVWRRSLSLT